MRESYASKAEPTEDGRAAHPARALESYLREHGIEATLLFPGRDTSTVPAAAEALGVRPDQIVKSLLFSGKDGATVLVIARGNCRIDRRKLVAATGLRKPQLAPPDVVLEQTGYPAGGTPPVGHATRLRVFLDPAVLDEPIVYGGGGRDDAMLRIRPADILRLTGARVVPLCQDGGAG